MAIPSGTKLGSYEVIAQIGAGGMGEVYQSRDAKLGREVAIKVLPEAFAHDPERLTRFQREAKMLAALNHPNIATIHGLEQSGSASYLVMELVSGETLAERVKRDGAVPIEEALSIAKQIAEALEAAHEKAIIHRDLKPANVKVTPEGRVKVLDFGLAKAFADDPSTVDMSNSPTLSMAATMQGVILGTAAYMSPEQAKGKAVDKRTDIWACGAVLYELLTGKQVFTGEDVTEILAAVVKSEPDWNQLPGATPLAIKTLLRRCLRKDKHQRLPDAAAVRIEIEEALNGTSSAETIPDARGLQLFGWIPTAMAVVLLLLLAALSFVHFRETPPGDSVLNLSVPLPGNSLAGFTTLSPDGRRLVVGLFNQDKFQLWLRSLDSPQLQSLPGTENARGPFWSPDSKSIGFFVDGKLKTMPATGGPPQVLCDGTGIVADGTWNRNGIILFSSTGVGAPLRRVNAAGGVCTAVTKPEDGSSHSFPEFLPDANHFVYVVRGGDESKRGLYVAALDNPSPRRLLADESSAVFVPSTTGKKYGYLLFLRGSELMAQPFSAETLQLAGDLFPVAAETSINLNGQTAASASASGILVYEINLTRLTQLTWLDRSGKNLGKVGDVQEDSHVVLSPDGKTAATTRRNQGIWLLDLTRGAGSRFTSSLPNSGAAVWSPDGKVIAFGAGKGLYLEDASGGSKERLLLENENNKRPSDWSRDGRYLIYTETDPKGQGDIWYVLDPLNKSNDWKPVMFQGTNAVESQGQLSPDGYWLAYVSDESGQQEVYVRPFPSGPGRWKISAGRGLSREPRWRRDGKELFFLESGGSSNRLMAIAVQSGQHGEFQAGAPQALFEFAGIGVIPTANSFIYSPSADGQRFLVRVQPSDAAPTVNVITNWEKAALGSR
jgi:eukaryotic-like serine/threonine-protein kinase